MCLKFVSTTKSSFSGLRVLVFGVEAPGGKPEILTDESLSARSPATVIPARANAFISVLLFLIVPGFHFTPQFSKYSERAER